MFCISKLKQLNMFEQISELNNLKKQQPIGFIKLLSENFDIQSFIPESFTQKYYAELGRHRKYELPSVLSALILMQLFHIPTTVLLNLFLIFSTELREFCCFYDDIPDESFLSRFKTDFEADITDLFNAIVPQTISICEDINASLPADSPNKDGNSKLIYDTSGLKPRVKENNPKTLVSEVNRMKSYAKVIKNKDFNPYAAAYKNMPKFADANHNIKLDFVNGHFGYFYKFGLITNGWGIPLYFKFFDKEFYKTVEKEFETPEDQKYCYDNFGFLKQCGFEKVFIPINPRNKGTNKIGDLEYDVEGLPLCPLDKTPFKAEGPCKGKCYHTCENPCTDKKSGRMTYVYPDKDFRLCPGVQRNSKEWDNEYHGRACIERSLSSLKSNPCIELTRSLNTATMRADLCLTAISKLITVILAYSINKPEYIRSISKLLKIAV